MSRLIGIALLVDWLEFRNRLHKEITKFLFHKCHENVMKREIVSARSYQF